MSVIIGHHGLLLSGGRWSPAQLTVPPKLWLDDASAVTDVSGAASQWNDRSGNGWHFTQATSASRPQIVASSAGGKRALRFDGSNDFMQAPSGALSIFNSVSSAWVFAVVKKTSSDATPTSRILINATTASGTARVAFYSDDATSGSANRITYGGRRLDAGAYQSIRTSATVYDTWVMALGCTDYAGRTIRLYRDGALDGSATTAFDAAGNTSSTNSTAIFIGGASAAARWAGDMSVAMLGVGLPTTDERDKIFGWAAWRYGLEANLPIGHPYKSAPP